MSIPGSNVRPRIFDFGELTTNTTVTETVEGNIVFVVTFVSMRLFAGAGQSAEIAIGNGVCCAVTVDPLATAATTVFEHVVCDIALEGGDEVNIVNNAVGGALSWVIAGYTWAHDLPG